MSRPVLAACAVVLASLSAQAAPPKPLWEIEVGPADKVTAPGWLNFSPDGKSVVAVVVKQGAAANQDFNYQLRVWDANGGKQRFTAELGRGRVPSWGDE